MSSCESDSAVRDRSSKLTNSISKLLIVGAATCGAALAQAPRAGGPTQSAAGARAYFIDLEDGASIATKVTVRLACTNMGVAPAGADLANSGHHHLLIDTELPPFDEPISQRLQPSRFRRPTPAPNANALGIMPAVMAMVVITMGRARFWPASMMAVARSTPMCIASIAKSTSMFAFLVTMHISMRMPITTGVVIGEFVAKSPMIAPATDKGSENRMVNGCGKPANSTASTI